MNPLLDRLTGGAEYRDILFSLAVVVILTVLILPVPAFILDLGLAVSLAFSVLVLMTTLWIRQPLDLSSFPTILLIATMIRLALNLASTRLILAEGHTGTDAAGGVIQGFAGFIMSGNFMIGVIVFSILVIVNFVVITKGSTRIAEVSARFALDSLPGKQMAIDADLSAGLLTEVQARERRKSLEEESAFFGSMDGASKFVRGDAVAGLIITVINVIGGVSIGMLQNDMSFTGAAETYTILTVGDGLVSQIPALIISLAAGLLVSKGGNVGSAEKALIEQLAGYPKAIGVASGLMFLLGLVPGLPFIPFAFLGGCLAGIAYGIPRWAAQREAEVRQKEEADKAAAETAKSDRDGDALSEALRVDPISLEVGTGLISLLSEDVGGILPKIRGLRQRFAADHGFLIPPVRMKDTLHVDPQSYSIKIQGTEVGSGRLYKDQVLLINSAGGDIPIDGEDTVDPTFGIPARWVSVEDHERAEALGFTVVDPGSVLITHASEIIKEYMPTLLTYAETQKLLDEVSPEHAKLVQELVPGTIPVSLLQKILGNLLSEQISIKNLPIILEGIAEALQTTRNPVLVTEQVRQKLAIQICNMLKDSSGLIPIISISARWEQVLLEGVIADGDDRRFSMSPADAQDFMNAARSKIKEYASRDEWPAILVAPEVRPYVASLFNRISPNTPIISHAELHRKAAVQVVDQI